MAEKPTLDSLLEAINTTNRLLAMLVLGPIDKQKDKVLHLRKAGFGVKDISALVGCTAAVVRNTLNRAGIKPVRETHRDVEEHYPSDVR